MSITGKIKTLFSDKEKTEAVFPRTKVSAVSDDNGNSLDAILDNYVVHVDDYDSEVTTAPLNADTLGGYQPTDYVMPYKAGDSVTFSNVVCSGFVTTSATRIYALLPLSKPCTTTTATLSNFTAQFRGISGYLNNDNSFVDVSTNYTVVTAITPNGIRMQLTHGSTIDNVTNNTPVIVYANVTVTFS